MITARKTATYYKCSECGHVFYEPVGCPKCKSKKFKKYKQKERRVVTKQ